MKKGIIITLSVIGGLVLLLALAPFLFKDKIKAVVDEQIAKNVNAQVYYDAEQFDLSIFRNFPNLTLSLGDFGMIGKVEEFKGDTLFAAKKFRLELDIMSVISGDKISVKGLTLDEALVVTKVADNGKSSWDIAMPSTDTTTATPAEEPSTMAITVDHWEINKSIIVYEDKPMKAYAKFTDFNHSGSGEITTDIYDLITSTNIGDVYARYEGVTYLNHQTFKADATLNIDMKNSKYTFKDNQFALNDFKFGFDGFVEMPENDMIMDITFGAKETTFKNLISLIPSVFTKDYNNIETNGTLAFNGYAKGHSNDKQQPAFGITLLVKDGMLKYPSLPEALNNVNIDLNVETKDGNMANLLVNLKKFHMEFGKTPVDARLVSKGIDPVELDANILAKLKLEDITKVFPVEGTTLKGNLALDVKAKGKYSDSLHLMPVVSALIDLSNGFVKSDEFPLPLEQVFFNTNIQSDGSTANTTVDLNRFQMILDQEKFEATAHLKNLDNIVYQATFKGIIDLAKMTKVYPIEGTTLSGRLNMDIQTKGTKADIDAGKYQNTATSGTMSIDKLSYVATDFKQGLTIDAAQFSFDPAKMNISSMKGKAGKSDYNVNGYFSNYMGYVFGAQDSTLRGTLNYTGQVLDVNEWMSDDAAATTTAAPTTTDTTNLSPAEVPSNLDFNFNANVAKVLYDNLTLSNFKGNVFIKNSILTLKALGFETLGGTFLSDMSYNTQNIKDPQFAMDMNIQHLSFKEAFKAFNTVQKIAPVAKNMEGNMDLKILMAGSLDKGMNVIYNTLNGKGSMLVPNAQLANSKVLETLASVTKAKGVNPLQINNVKINFTIVNGGVVLEPFDVKAGDIKMNVGGTTQIEGDMNMLIKMDVPTGAAGEAAANAVNSLTGVKVDAPKNIKFDLNMTGTYDNPKVKIVSTSADKGKTNEAVKQEVKQEVVNQIKNNEQAKQAQAELDKQKADAEARARAEQERLQREAQERSKAEQDRLKKEAENKAKDALKNTGIKW